MSQQTCLDYRIVEVRGQLYCLDPRLLRRAAASWVVFAIEHTKCQVELTYSTALAWANFSISWLPVPEMLE